MQVKKGELLLLYHVLENLKNRKSNVKFSYFVAKNKLALQGEVDALNEAQEASEPFKLYDQKRAELAANMADRLGDTNQPMTQNGQYVITKRKEEFDSELEKLKKTYAEVIEERDKQIEVFRDLLEEKIDFKGHGTKLENIPGEIEPVVMESLIKTGLILED
jgi:hypothetical protein